MKRSKLPILMLLEVILMLALFGCGRQKYTLEFDGPGFRSRRTEYRAGETVKVYYDRAETEADSRFWLDDGSVPIKQDYDARSGYALSFPMPAHDVTLHALRPEPLPKITVSFVNGAEEADVWILPQTEANLKTTLWGTATVGALSAGETAEVSLEEAADAETWLVRIIDRDHAYYSARDVVLEDGYSIIFRAEDSRYAAVIEVLDREGTVIFSHEAFTGVLGGR